MHSSSRSGWYRIVMWYGVFAIVAVLLTACGGKETPADLCDEVFCLFGVCDPGTGACANAEVCEKADDCLAGYECSDTGACEPLFSCVEDADCPRGVCSEGVCLNPEQCAITAECIDGYYCSREGSCQVDQCTDTSCPRGQCNPASGECANAPACTVSNQATACLEGFYCLDDQCASEADLCASLSCDSQRGVCDAASRSCVNAANCAGSDMNCQSGYFCSAQNTCRINRCDNGNQCERGVCDPGSGACVNPTSCTTETQCADGNYCIDGACQEVPTACAACTGNQVCDYDDGAMSVACKESPTGCRNALDCLEDRSCRFGVCVEAAACEADAYEPNDTVEEATNLNTALAEGIINGTMCASDVDYYTYNTVGAGYIRGTLVVEARIAGEDIGHGNLRVEILNGSGEVLSQVVADSRGVAAMQLPLNAAQMGTYTVRVQSEPGLSTAGLRYTLYGDFVSTLVASACNEAPLLPIGETAGNTRQSLTYQLQPSCTDSPNTAAEDIYRFELTERSLVQLTLVPAFDTELTLSLRQSCFSNRSELSCENNGQVGVRERISVQLDPGEYHVLVKGPRANTGGGYSLIYETTPIICVPGQSYCETGNQARICNAGGSEYTRVPCTMGCDADLGLCNRVAGDACYAAIDATNGYSGSINWSDYTNEYTEQPASCFPAPEDPENPPAPPVVLTSGADVAYRVEVPAGYVVQADLDTFEDYASLYIVADCLDMADSCLALSTSATEVALGGYRHTAFWENEGATARTVYVIANSDALLTSGIAQIEISTGERICDPGVAQCAADGVAVCNAAGTALVASHPCPFGCSEDGTRCGTPRNDTCKGAVDIVAEGGVFRAGIQDYSRTYNPGRNTCLGTQEAPGSDATFFVDAKAGEVITARLSSTYRSSLYIVTGCDDVAGSCVSGSHSGINEVDQLVYVAPRDDRYFIIADSNATNQSGVFELQVTVSLPTCPANSFQGCLDDDNLGYCTGDGALIPYGCDSGCVGGTCAVAAGDICYDAIPVSSGQTVSDYFKGSNFNHMPQGDVGSCSFSAPVTGGDTYYAVDMLAGQVLHVTAAVSTTVDGLFYILEDCGDKGSCVDNTFAGEAGQQLIYRAEEDRTVFVVAARQQRNWIAQSYTVTFNVFDAMCDAGQTQCADGQTVEYCGSLGTFERYTCLTGGCSDGACANRRGDVCADAVPLENYSYVTGVINGSDTLNMPRNRIAGACEIDTWGTPGPDTFYSFEAQAGQRVTIDYETNRSSTRLYLMSDCDRRNTCMHFEIPNREDLNATDGVIVHDIEADGTYFLVVDTWGSGGGNFPPTYAFSLAVQSPDACTPGEVTCLAGTSALGICNNEGTYDMYQCADGCNEGACGTPRGGRCEDVLAFNAGESVSGDFNGQSTIAFDVDNAGSCDFGSATNLDGRDTVYSVAVRGGELLQLHLDSVASDAFMFILEQCGQGESCLDNTAPSNNGYLEHYAEQDETIFVVVTHTGPRRSVSSFTLHSYVQVPGCTPGEQVCYEDGKTLGLCDERGVLEPRPCDGSCYIDACEIPGGDFCEDVIALYPGDEVRGSWDGFNYIDAGTGTHGACQFSVGAAQYSRGRERIYAIEIPDGQVMRASLFTAHAGATMYLLEDCGDVGTCMSITEERGAQTFDYLSRETRTYYLVVDSTNANITGTSPKTFRLQVDLENPSCYPQDRQCNAAGTGIEVCNDTGVFDEFACGSGACSDGWCTQPSGDTCTEPLLITASTVVTGDYNTPRTNAIQLPTGSGLVVGECAVGTSSTPGRDTIYAVQLEEGQVLNASLRLTTGSTSLNRLYVLEECGVANSCQAFETGNPLGVRYLAGETGIVYLVVDSAITSTSSNYVYELTIDLEAPQCQPGARMCSAEGDALECDRTGAWQVETICKAGGCTDGYCDLPQGDTCAEATPLTSGETYYGNWTGENTLNPGSGSVGSCTIAGNTGGRETIYSIEAQAGDFIKATLETTQTNANVYILSDCADENSCVAAAPNVGASTTGYIAQQTGTYFVVVDRTATATTGDFQLTVVVDTVPECEPGEQQCNVLTDTIEYCTPQSVWVNYENTSCAGPTGNYCWDAIYMEHGSSHVGTWTGTNELNPGTGVSGQCNLTMATAGSDTFYAMDLVEGDVLIANLTTTHADAYMYIVEDCSDGNSCLAAADDRGATRLQYLAQGDQRVFIVVDRRFSASNSTSYTLDVSIRQTGECVSGELFCADANTLAYCDEQGLLANFTCSGGCADARCGTPIGDVCFDAVPLVVGGSVQATLSHTDATNFHDPGLESCIYSATSYIGGDFVTYVDLDEGDLLSLSVATSATSQTGIYILEECAFPMADACVIGTPPGVRELDFIAPTTGRYYVVVDINSTTNSNRPTVSATVTPGTAGCQPGRTSCEPVTGILEVCSDEGREVTGIFQCQFGCNRDYCAPPPETNDTCDAVATIDAPTTILDSYGRFTNTINMGASTCGGFATNGPDAFYRVTIPANYTLTANVNAVLNGNTPAVYLVESCADALDTCIVGDRSSGSAELQYLSVTGGDYFLVVDSGSTSASADLILSVDLEMAECTPGAAFCDGSTSQTCSDVGFYVPFDCPYGCVGAGECLAPTNNTCEGAFDLSAGGVVTAELDDFYTNEYDTETTGCTGSYQPDGPEAVFYVDALKNEVIRASLTSGFLYKVLWISDTCDGQGTECLDGASNFSGSTAVNVEYRVPEDGRYYIFVDRRSGAASNRSFTLTVNVDPPACEAFEIACLDENSLGYCPADGSGFIAQSCNGGCQNGACAEPEGDICPDPIVVSASGTYFGDWANFNNRHDPGYTACTGFNAPGPDQVFFVALAAGQTLTASLANGAGIENDLSLYAVTNCLEVGESCVTGSDLYGSVAEGITYTAAQDMVLYVIADTWNQDATGDFQLVIDIQ